jgi:rare lipoprotein A
MLFKTISIFAFGLLGLAPLSAKATSSYSNCGYASNYGIGDGYNGQRSASGERFNAYSNTAAHRWYPFGTRLRVTNQSNGRSVIVRINDRGPYVASRDLDLSYGAFSSIASSRSGVARVCYSVV